MREPAALVIAHPGHELRLHHWLETARPLTLILTDGSGHDNRGRLDSTSVLLARAGARRGSIYGRLSDAELYRAVLAGDHGLFVSLAGEIADVLQREGIRTVVGDAVEGFNPGHDLCRLVLNAALLQLEHQDGRRIANMEFLLEGTPNGDAAGALRLALDDAAWQRKLDAGRAYPEMAAEIDRSLAIHGGASFRTECFRPVRYGLDIAAMIEHPCFYERHGEKRVAEGFYSKVIRFREHIAPIAEALAAAVGKA